MMALRSACTPFTQTKTDRIPPNPDSGRNWLQNFATEAGGDAEKLRRALLGVGYLKEGQRIVEVLEDLGAAITGGGQDEHLRAGVEAVLRADKPGGEIGADATAAICMFGGLNNRECCFAVFSLACMLARDTISLHLTSVYTYTHPLPSPRSNASSFIGRLAGAADPSKGGLGL